jgi:hypothetical protein
VKAIKIALGAALAAGAFYGARALMRSDRGSVVLSKVGTGVGTAWTTTANGISKRVGPVLATSRRTGI